MNSSKHTVSAFDEDLESLRSLILDMGDRTAEAIFSAIVALKDRDTAKADAVVAADKTIDALHHQAEDAAVNLIALRAPMADDLRTIVSAIKLSALLERTADYAKNIAKRVKSVSGEFPEPIWQTLSKMSKEAAAMQSDVVRAFARGDAKLAEEIIERDDTVDDLHDDLTKALLEYMIDHPDRISQATHLMFISKHLERIGDQATNVAEAVTYAVTGEQAGGRDTDDQLAA